MSLRLAAHWTATTVAAALAEVLAPVPFTGPDAGTVGALAVIGVAAVGYATAPAITRRDGRS
ncbi:MAG: hypothetical protein HOV92_00665 [Streptomyces sp.]|nr:hypothetical protein [Streptomyces sp.]